MKQILPQALDDLPPELVIEYATVAYQSNSCSWSKNINGSNSADNVWYGQELHKKYHLKDASENKMYHLKGKWII